MFTLAFPLYREDWRPAVWALAVLTLAVGSIAAVIQTDVKRVLAYSSIAHAGYILIGFQVATPAAARPRSLYLFVYAFMTIGAFAVVTIVGRRGDDHHSLDDYRGLALRRPVLGGLLAFFLLAQAGVPADAGVHRQARGVRRGRRPGRVRPRDRRRARRGRRRRSSTCASSIALFTPPAADEPADETEAQSRPVDLWSGIVLFVAAGMTLVIGVLPGTFITFSKGATFLL